MTKRQKRERQLLLTSKSKALYEAYTSFESFYNYYLSIIEDYESLEDVPYPKREQLIRLCNIYHQSDSSYRFILRKIYNFDKIVHDELEEFNFIYHKNRDNSFKKRQLGGSYEQ